MRRLLSLISIALMISMVLSVAVFADDTSETETPQEKQVVGIGTSVIKAPDAKLVYTDPWKGSYVWFGKYDGTPVKYRVLAPQTNSYGGNTMFLDCNSILYKASFNSTTPNEGAQYPNEWKYSNIRAHLNDDEFLNKENGFTDIEKNAITNSWCGSYSYKWDFYEGTRTETYIALSGEKIFLLDKDDLRNESYGFCELIEKGFAGVDEKANSLGKVFGWWLRSTPSSEAREDSSWVNNNLAASIGGGGASTYSNVGNSNGVSPAFNVDLNKVVFISLISGTVGQNDAEYKLTLFDDSLPVKIPSGEKVEGYGNWVTIPYSITGTNASNVNQLSVLILDEPYSANAHILYYGKLDTSETIIEKQENGVSVSERFISEGRSSLALPSNLSLSGWGSSYYVYLLVEDINDTYETDYASYPLLLEKPINPTKPIITEQPVDTWVTVGDTASFTVEAVGQTPLSYQWQSREPSSSAWVNLSENSAKTSTLSIETKLEDLGRQFRCAVTDANGRTAYSSPGTLLFPPVIIKPPVDTFYDYISGCGFYCEAVGVEIQYKWQYDGRDQKGRLEGPGSCYGLAGFTTGYYGRKIRCIVTDNYGHEICSDIVRTTMDIHVLKQPENAIVCAGETVRFTVEVDSTDSYYSWYWRRNPDEKWQSGGGDTNKNSVEFVASEEYNGYQYRCKISEIGELPRDKYEVYSDIVTITVIPKISQQPTDTYAVAGSTATFSVSASGKEPISYQWQSRKNSTSDWVNSGQSGSKTNTLSVATQKGLNGWQFRCAVTDGKGATAYSEPATLFISPLVTAHPQNKTVEAGSTVEFTIKATGKETLSYQWQSRKDVSSSWSNSGLTGSKTATLSVSASGGLSGWQFRCVVTDDYGKKAYSNEATLTVVPKITTQPANTSVTAGSTATFTVVAAGKATLTYQWQSRKDSSSDWVNSGQSGAKTATLSVTAVAGLNGWQFRCLVTDGNGNKVTSNAAKLTIIKITSQPKSVVVAAGATAKFTVAASGAGTLTYQWQSRKDASSSWSNSGQSGAKTATLSIAASGGLNGWQFRCVIKDGNGKTIVSEAATLTVVRITTQPSNVSVTAGATAKFTVEAAGASSFTYQWQSRKDASSDWVNSGQSGAKTATLSVTTIAGLNGWQFRCVVKDASGNTVTSNPATLSIFRVTTQPKNTSAAAGATAKFTVAVAGSSGYTYQWQSRKDASSSWSNSGQTGAKTATLSISASTGLNGWQFRCIVKDANGYTVTSNAATLSIIRITTQPKSVSVKAGATAKFTVAASGAGTLTYQWQSRKNSSSSWSNSGQTGAKTTTLSISASTGLNGWQFRCIVKDANGKQIESSAATLTVTK